MLIEQGSTLLMMGDSITDCERARPLGEGKSPGGWGAGYVSFINALLGAGHPEQRIRVINMGNSGDTVLHLQRRWQTDVLDLAPDWLSVMIGINDVWRQYDQPLHPDTHVSITQYEETLDALLTRTRPALKGLVLIGPYVLERDRQDPWRAQSDAYTQVVKQAAARHQALFVDSQAALDPLLQHQHATALAWDRIHLMPAGHAVLARQFLKAIGYCW